MVHGFEYLQVDLHGNPIEVFMKLAILECDQQHHLPKWYGMSMGMNFSELGV